MFWRSVVGKLAVTILLLVSFVLFILTILLLEFFENFHLQEAEKSMLQTASQLTVLVNKHDDKKLIKELTENIKDPSSKVIIYFDDGEEWESGTSNENLTDIFSVIPENQPELMGVLTDKDKLNEKIILTNQGVEVMVIGSPVTTKSGGIFIYETLDVINQTRAETTKILFLAAAIAIVLTTIFAFFLSSRITAPLIEMRKAAFDLARGEFNKRVPILTHDEIGELAVAFNDMGKQLNFHINALHQEKEQLSGIVNSMADGVITLSREGDIIVINPPAEQFIQDCYFESELVSVENQARLPKELTGVLRKVIADEKEVLQEINIQGRDWVMIMTPLYDRTYVRGAVAVIRDMTEERQMDKLRKDFISNVSHELRTPIALMQGYSEAIVDDIAETVEDKNELAQIIHDESVRMGRLVNELLDIGRMEAGHIELNYADTAVKPFLDRIYKKFIGLAQEKDVTMYLTYDNEKETAWIDADRIEQVFTNLIDNALSHTPAGGCVDVQVKALEKTFSADVVDNGSGIPEQDLSFIFERFYKADKSRTRNRKKKGTGLGLAIAKNIITAHGGTISVKSKVDAGTTFSFKIPQ